MRAAATLGLVALLPAIAQGQIVEFNFSGAFATTSNPNGPYDTFETTFLANTTAAGASLQYTFGMPGGPGGGTCLENVNASVPTYDVNLTLNGKLVLTDGTGSFGLIGLNEPDGCGIYFGEGPEVSGVGKKGTPSFSFSGGADVFLPNNSQSAILSSKDPLALILDGSTYSGDEISGIFGCSFPGVPAQAPCMMSLTGFAGPASVPEPNLLTLFAAGALGLTLSTKRSRPFKRRDSSG